MRDELDARVRALEAERARPVPPPRAGPPVEELMQRLIGTLAALWRTPPDRARKETA